MCGGPKTTAGTGGLMQRRSVYLTFALLVVSIVLTAADNPLIGTWKINLTKSTFSPGPMPMSSTVIFAPEGNGIRQSVNNVDAQGNKIAYSVMYAFDGKDYPVKGDPSR